MEQNIIRANFEYIYQKSTKLAINEYIRDLLLFEERVIFPGFGALEIIKKPAVISGAKMAPPSSELRFNSELKRDDGVLTAKVSQAEDIDEEEAREKVLEYIDSMVFAFNKGEQFVMEGVCTLFQDEDNVIRVEKDPSLNLEFDSFGLETLELDPFAGEEEEAPGPVEEAPEAAPVDVEAEALAEEEAGKEFPPEEAEQEIPSGPAGGSYVPDGAGIPPLENEPAEYHADGGGSGNRSTIWILSGAIVVVLCALVIMTLKTDLLDGTFDLGSLFKSSDSTLEINDDFSNLSDQDFEFDHMKNELETEIDSSTSIKNALNPPEKGNTKPEAAAPTKGFSEYHIIAGSFKDRENAAQLQQELTMKGFQCKIIERGDGYFRVSAGSFSDKQRALDSLQSFRKIKGMNHSWVMDLH